MRRLTLLVTASALLVTSTVSGQFEPLVDGVTALGSGPGSVPGSLYSSTSDWVCIASGNEATNFPHSVIMASEIGAGAAIAYGHGGFFTSVSHLDNSIHLLNATQWLDRLGTGRVAYTTGHGEWVNSSGYAPLSALLQSNGYTFESLSTPITASALAPFSVVFIGNAWGTITNNEMDALDTWIQSGGGVAMAGLGWSYPTLDEYPMNLLAARYGLRWIRGYAVDQNAPPAVGTTFDVFYPNAFSLTIDDAIDTLWDLHTSSPSVLANEIETNQAVRLPFAWAHLALAIPVTDFGIDDPDRDRIYSFYTSLVQAQPEFYARTDIIDPTTNPTVAHVRERFWKTFVDLLPLDSVITEELILNGALSEQRAELLRLFDLIILDNQRMATDQLGFIHDIYYLMPPGVVKPAAISANGFFGTSTVPIHLRGTRPGVNTFTTSMSGATENQFPNDIAPGVVPIFCSATSHEICHVVRSQTVSSNPAFEARHAQLIADAGDEPMNYLRSTASPGFFTNAPQEFFASIANQYFADSTKTLDLGVLRFQNGYLLPINQALFFMDVCSESTEWTPVFFTSTQGEITRHWAILDRDVNSRITGVAIDIRQFTFSYSSADNVISINESPSMRCNRVDITTQGASPLSPEYLMPDRLISGADLLLFVNLWVLEDARADMTTQGAPIGSMEHGVPDGLVSGADIQFYVNLWIAGCP